MDTKSHFLLGIDLSIVHTSLEPEVMLASENPKKRAGRKKFKVTRHPIYRGVRSRKFGKWVCEVRHPLTQSRVWLGTHATADMAAMAHDVAVLAMRGPSACLNFADSVWRLPIPQSSDVIDIQKAAVEAAKAFRPIVEIAEIVYDVVEDEIFAMPGVINVEKAAAEAAEAFGPIVEIAKIVYEVDEDEIFGMRGVIDSMAEGLMLPSPHTLGHGNIFDDVELFDDLSLWCF